MKIGFIGLGLIGGSIAKALHQSDPELVLIAYDYNQSALDRALDEGVICKACKDIDDNFADCDYIFLCVPVSENDDILKKLSNYLHEGMVLTDVGSVKGEVHSSIEKAGLSKFFIGGHPMAGSEKSGYDNARAELFENAYYMITPNSESSSECIHGYEELVRKIGAIPHILSPEKHDHVTGAISHLPHVIAAALVNFVRKEDENDGTMKMIAAGGFRDITRIASSSPQVWRAICTTNKANIVPLLDRYIEDLKEIRDKIAETNEEEITEFFSQAKDYRDSYNDGKAGKARIVYALHVDIRDELGALAKVADILAASKVSIKNIGIIHNREFEEGVLRIEFYNAKERDTARVLLSEYSYIVYDK